MADGAPASAAPGEAAWSAPPPPTAVLVAAPTLRVALCGMPPACMLTGDLTAALRHVAPNAPLIGYGPLAPASEHALIVARDRAVLWARLPADHPEGWVDGFAITEATGLFTAITLHGERADALMSSMTPANLDAASASAAFLINGRPCLVSRHGDGVHLHVRTSDVAYHANCIAHTAGHP